MVRPTTVKLIILYDVLKINRIYDMTCVLTSSILLICNVSVLHLPFFGLLFLFIK